MTLPPWKSDDPLDQEALAQFVIDRLEEQDERLMYRFARLFLRHSADPDFAAAAKEQLEAERLAKRHGGTIIWAEDKRRRGNPGHTGKFGRAVRDVPRIREIFRKHWPEKERRTAEPSAEHIAAKRWNLSREEATALHKRFQRG